jgi:hypothetical protein
VPNPFPCSRYNASRGLRVESLNVEFHECQQISSVLWSDSPVKVDSWFHDSSYLVFGYHFGVRKYSVSDDITYEEIRRRFGWRAYR